MSKVFISSGHGGNISGAVGYVVEKDVNLKMAIACANYLRKRGVDVLLSRDVDKEESLSEKISKCNEFKPDVAIECHNNAGGGKGFEIYHSIVGGVGKNLAKNIEDEVKKIGQNSRGLKTKIGNGGRDYFAFIRQTTCPAVICEGAFVDNKEDVMLIDTDQECSLFGKAYAKGILKTLNLEDKVLDTEITQPIVIQKPEINNTYKITIMAQGGLNIRKGPGNDYQVVAVLTDNQTLVESKPEYYYPYGVYTIVETKDNWGKLKSGIGWIYLDYTKRI